MKTFDELFDGVIKHEGYYANVPGDRGGETYMGVARNLHPKWEGWRIVDDYKVGRSPLKRNTQIFDDQLTSLVKEFYKEKFFDRNKIREILNGSLQEIIFDWIVNSGSYGRKGVQNTLNTCFDFQLAKDGIFGVKTITAINCCDALDLFSAIKNSRILFYQKIAKKGDNQKFLKGWLNRIYAIKYTG